MYSDDGNPEITKDLLLFDTKTNNWKNKMEISGGIPVTGHAAVVIQGTMYVFFGYNKDHTFSTKVQKLDLSKFFKHFFSV